MDVCIYESGFEGTLEQLGYKYKKRHQVPEWDERTPK